MCNNLCEKPSCLFFLIFLYKETIARRNLATTCWKICKQYIEWGILKYRICAGFNSPKESFLCKNCSSEYNGIRGQSCPSSIYLIIQTGWLMLILPPSRCSSWFGLFTQEGFLIPSYNTFYPLLHSVTPCHNILGDLFVLKLLFECLCFLDCPTQKCILKTSSFFFSHWSKWTVIS